MFAGWERNRIFHALYKKHSAAMLYAAAQIVGRERSEEAVQDVFLKLIEKYENNFSELRDKPALFFVVSVRNHSINLLRKEKLEMQSLDTYDYLPDSTSESSFESAEGDNVIVELIRSLEPTAREILEYRYIQDFSNKEIAEALGISESAVSSRLNRARSALKAKMEQQEGYCDD